MRVQSLVTLFLAAVLVVACGASGVRMVEAGGHVALIQSVDDGGYDALIEGVLAVNENSCLGLEFQDGTFTVAIWSPAFGLTRDGELRDSRGEIINLGDTVRAGGGEERFQQNYPDQAERCLAETDAEDAVVLVLNSAGEV